MMINKLSYLQLHLWEIIIPNYNTPEKTIPNHNTFWETIIPKHNTISGKNNPDDTRQTQ